MQSTISKTTALSVVRILHSFQIEIPVSEIERGLAQMSQDTPILEQIRQLLRNYGVIAFSLASENFRSSTPRAYVLTSDGSLQLLRNLDSSSSTLSIIKEDTEEEVNLKNSEVFPLGEDTVGILSIEHSVHSQLGSSKWMTTNPYGADAHDADDHHHLSGVQLLSKLWRLLTYEKKDILIVIAYSLFMGLLSLVVPLASQSLVNAVSLGVYTTQLTVLCIGVGVGLILMGVFHLFELTLVDYLRRRIFVRTAFEVAHILPRITMKALEGEYAPELVNRFFDVTTITKSLSKFLLDGISATLVALIGLILLALYHPFFLFFDLFLIVFIIVLVGVLGRGALRTSIEESRRKYAVAHWLEDVARCRLAFKLSADPDFVLRRLNTMSEQYVHAHRRHFMVIARQVAGSAFFRSVATVGVLGLGGILVIDRQLTLGQLVAAELVVIALLGSLEKLISQFEDFYDLLTAIDKMSAITDKELDTARGDDIDFSGGALEVEAHRLSFSYTNGKQVLRDLSFRLPAGSRVSLVGENGAGKTTCSELLAGLYQLSSGTIEFNKHDLRSLSLQTMRRSVSIFSRHDSLFAGTIEDNICMGRRFDHERVRWALTTAGLDTDMQILPHGLYTQVLSEGSNLASSLIRRIVLARCIISKPGLLILDEALEGLERSLRRTILERLYAESHWTILDITNDQSLLQLSTECFVLEKGFCVESGSTTELLSRSESRLQRFFSETPENPGSSDDKKKT